MARASYRRRPDGVLEIVRPHPLQRVGGKMKAAAAGLLVLLLAALGAGLYATFGVPVILMAGCAVFVAVVWKSGQPRRQAPPLRSVGERRSAP